LRFIALLTFLLLVSIKAQTQECGNSRDFKKLKHENPKAYQEFLRLEKLTQDYISRTAANPNARLIDENGTITIPVVFHILNRGEAVGTGTNISDARINSQMDALNQCYSRTNNQAAIPIVFRNVAGNPNLRFVLACRDPNGNVTTGILRKQSATQFFTYSEKNAQRSSQGGDDAWPTDRYLNVWATPNLSDGNSINGYCLFPDEIVGSPELDGPVVRSAVIGIGTALPDRNEGRTLVHEIGHWLNVFHTFSDDGTCTDDQCADTPIQANSSIGVACPIVFPFRANNCPSTPNGIMYENFMDYTDDRCGRRMFTQNQVQRIRAVFQPGGPRRSFIDNYFKLVYSGYRTCVEEFDFVASPFCEAAGNINWSITGPASLGFSTGFSTYVNPWQTSNGTAILTASWNNFTSDLSIPVGYGAEGSLYSYSGNSFANTPIYSGGSYPAKTNSFGKVSFTGGIGTAQNWQVISQTGSAYFYGYGNNFNVSAYPPSSSITVKGDINTACGIKTVQYTFYYSPYGYGGGSSFRLSPNPASNTITINASNVSTDPNARIGDTPEFEVQIFSRYSQLMKTMKYPKGSTEIQMDVSNLPSNQLYTARIVSSTDTHTLSFFKE
jgi:Pregnancy-associated plasma protein-A